MTMKIRLFLGALVAAGISAGFVGCSSSADKSVAATTASNGEQKSDGWWCAEHGVPEADCAQCNKKLVAEFKAKGDWCKEHNRPESQCFICHPEKEAEFAAQYEAKFGTKPPTTKHEG